MEDDDDNENIASDYKIGENTVGSKVSILKNSKDSGLSSRRDRRRDKSKNRDGFSRRGTGVGNANSGPSRNRGGSGKATNSNSQSSAQWSNDARYNSSELLDITSLSESYNGETISPNKITNLLANLPEDMRISKLLRQLSAEKDAAETRKICIKLNIVIMDGTNTGYIRRSFDILADHIQRTFKEGPADALNDVAVVFGKMGWIARSDFSTYRQWIQKMHKSERIREYALRALQETLEMDAKSREIRNDNCNRIIEMLKEYLDSSDKSSHFVAVTNVIQQFAQNYPKSFQPHFADIVDFVIGWHLETDQLLSIKQHCSFILQKFKNFWLSDVTFTRNLLNQFLEDIVSYRDEIQSQTESGASGSTSSTPTPEICFGSIVGATNSILKCIYDTPAVLCQHIGIDLLSDIIRSVLEMIQAFENLPQKQYTPDQCDVIYMYVNELIVIALDCRKIGVEVSEEMLLETVETQLKNLSSSSASDQKIIIILFVIYKLVAELKSIVPITFLQSIFSTQSDCVIHQLKFSRNPRIVKSIVKLYQTVLNLKIVEMLQEVYQQIVDDLMMAIEILVSKEEEIEKIYTKQQAECLVNFYLRTISTLAVASSSIIVMWALEPNLLELLTERLQTADYDEFWKEYPETHFAIISLLISHCRNNNNFIASSSLINEEITKITDIFGKLNMEDSVSASSFSEFVPGAASFNIPVSKPTTETSPTAGHFEIILKFLNKLLKEESITEHLIINLLDLCDSLMRQISVYSHIFKGNVEFLEIIESINEITSDILATKVVQIKAADCFDALLTFDDLHTDTLESIAEMCCVKMCVSDALIRKHYSNLFAKLPLNVSLKQVNQFTGLAKAQHRHINNIQHWYLRTPTQQRGGEMRSKFVADFIRAIKIRETDSNAKNIQNQYEIIEKILKNIFIHSQNMCTEGVLSKTKLSEIAGFCKVAMADVRVLISWAQWEAAQSCVNNKLRTFLGKPQETFLKIESIIKENARILSLKEKLKVPNVDTILANQRNARILLGFMEALEKYIYNASEGTVCLPPAEKPARTFFHLNAITCNEWFNRIRTAVDLVALHCMEPEMVIRYTENVLKNLAANGKFNEPLFEHTLMSHTWALLRNKEGDALEGLFVWTKAITKKKLMWIKMAAEQANGRLETAVAGYKMILTNLDESKIDSHLREFIFDQLTVCLANAQEWHDLLAVLRAEENRNVPRSTIPLLSLNSKQIEHFVSFIDFQTAGNDAIQEMGEWEVLNNDENGIANDFSYHRLISLTENTICNMSIESKTKHMYNTELQRTCSEIVQSGLQECLRTRSREHLNNLVVMNHICHKVSNRNLTGERENTRSLCVDKSFGSTALTVLLNWSQYFDNTEVGQQINLDLRLDVCSTTRKEGNLTLCRKQLEVFFDKINFCTLIGCDEPNLDLICDRLIDRTEKPQWKTNIWDKNTTRSVYEMAKWLYSYPDKKETAIQFAAANAISICDSLDCIKGTDDESAIQQRIARTYLTLGEWLQSESDQFLIESANKPIGKLIHSLDDVHLRDSGLNYESSEVNSLLSPIDIAIGKLLSQSVQQCPDLSKAYGAYGNWCYRWGRKIVELRTEKDDKAGLRSSDLSNIKDLIPNASASDIELISNVLNSHKVSTEDEELVVSNSDDISSTEVIELQLRQIGILSNCSTETLQKIIEIWRLANRNIYSFYEMAAEAYFKYLQLATQSHDDGLNTVTNISDDGKFNENCSVVTATLRILRLIVKHALGLQEVLEQGLATTPTSPWKIIIPQLFSRLNHHEPYVRKRVSELLCRVARDSPHLIIFPAVVGAAQEQRVNFTDLSTFSPSDHQETKTQNSALTICFNQLLDTLSKQAAEQVQQVQLLVRELKRITLLWEELWLSSLTQVYSECTKRVTVLENDLIKLTAEETSSKQVDESKRALLVEKYRVIVRPVLFVMERLNEATSVKAVTANELAFQERFSDAIQGTINSLKETLTFSSTTPEGWSKFKSLYTVLQQRSQKRSASIKMTDISPVLAQLKNTVIPMPGIENHQNRSCRSDSDQNRWIYIKSVDNFVQTLPTKTKPKKIAVYGSDGRKYTYLFKGLEDLHLDERIMQFLSIANSMMSKTRANIGQTTKYRAKHYSVTPLGAHSGLITWVDGMTPIFALYKKWQQRQATNLKKEKSPSTTTAAKNTPPQAIARPSELYFQKLTPLLNKHNIKATQSSRKEWPLQVLKEVLADLTAETPRDLLAKELWCYSTNAAEWRQVIRNYAQSLAVMSVIGYVIGLGDRHLDNILIDLMTGEILHIDYNVCFEKGKTLRVPEKVPFRMTPNLQEALGVTGIEGTFRLACEHVLKTLKKGRETLLTLLEAFVYDPLVDWAVAEDTIGGDTATTSNRNQRQMAIEKDRPNAALGATEMAFGIETARKQMQDEITRDTLIIQFNELKPDWLQNRDGIFNQLKQVQAYLLNLQQQRIELQSLEKNRMLLGKQAAMVSEAGALDTALGSHPLNTLAQRYSSYKQKKDECDNCRRTLLDRMSNCTKQMMDYHNCLQLIETNKIAEHLTELNDMFALMKVIPPNHAFDLVKDFLDNSAQKPIYLQSCQLSSGLDVLVTKQITTIQQSLETLIEYGAITRYHPPSVHAQHRLTKYAEWCKYLADHQSVQDCRDVITQLQTTMGKNAINKIPVQQVITFSYSLQTTLRDGEFKLQKLLERLNVETDNNVIDGNSTVNIIQYTNLFEDARNSIRIFIQDQSILSSEMKYNVLALHCVTITILCDLNKRLLMMENAAANSGDNMVDLTFNGNWVLDELYAHSAIMCEMASIIEKAHRDHATKTLTEQFLCAAQCLREIQSIHENLREFNEQFSMNILNDVLYGIISEKQSILDMISALSSLQESMQSIPQLLSNLYLHLRHGTNADLTTKQACNDVAILRQKLNTLKMQMEQTGPNEIGSKLFLRINGLFEKLDDEYDRLIDCLQDLNLLGDQRKIDQIRNSIQLASTILSTESRSILRDIFFVKKIEAMVEFFTMILQIACSFKAAGMNSVYEDSQLCRPLRKYLTDFVWRKMFGLQSYCVTVILCDLLHGIDIDVDGEINLVDVGAQNVISMEELCCKSIDKYIRNEKLPKMILSQATTICWNLDGAWRKLCTVQNIQNQVTCQQNTMLRTQLILTAHFWMNEEALTKQTGFSIIPTRNRATVILKLDETTKTLTALQSTVQRQKDELSVLTTAINQRLKWAAGANPQLVDMMNDYVSTISNRQNLIDKIGLLAAIAIKENSAILQYEKLRVTTTEALDEDQKFLNLISRWEKCCKLVQTVTNVVTPVEEALIELLDPEGPIDRMWLNSVSALIDDMVNQVQQDISKIERKIVDSQDELQSSAYRLRSLMVTHSRIAPKILNLVNTIYRIIDDDKKLILSEYVDKHNLMKENITELQGHILSKDFTEELVNVTVNQTADLLNTMKDTINNLINAGNLLTENDKILPSPVIAQIQQQDCIISRPNSPSKSKAQKGMEQKRNAYAVSVWRRIRMKLEGRDPDPTRRYSTAEQVDWMIREAMDPNNLAVLYEGWTPWV